jgi:predicted lipid-binding transport protein (Tim44 family)
MMTMRTLPILRALLALALVAGLAAGPAEARHGGSFGSRGSRTYYAPSPTRLTPGYTAPISRSMTARSNNPAPQYAPAYGPPYAPTYQPRFGFGGGLLTGIVTGGLIGAMMGHSGWGGGYGGGGMLTILIQLVLFGGLIWLVMRMVRGGGSATSREPFNQPSTLTVGSYPGSPAMGGGAPSMDSIAIGSADQDAFERLLIELQDAFGHEDYARLRAITTPEIMSYLAEELSDNATHGRRNEVTGTRLLDGEVSEAWNEGGIDYATIAMRYESIDVMRDRTTNAVLSGDPSQPSQTTELWTFARTEGAWSTWKVSAIQEA